MTLFGVVRQGLPWIQLHLPTQGGSRSETEFVVDTGFEGQLAGPSQLLSLFDARYSHDDLWALADGTLKDCPVYVIEVDLFGTPRNCQNLVLEGNLLAGTEFFRDCQLSVDLSEGGEVQIDLPD